MTNAEIQSFLAICRYKTVTSAAERLYISQSALSTRLRALETSVGDTLFHRHKGSREMVLTAKGKAFYDLAVQYEDIVNKMEQLCNKDSLSLRVASLNSLGSFLLPAVYEAFIQEHPEAELEIQEFELVPACRSIQRGLTDPAFTAGSAVVADVQCFPIFSEPMVLLRSGDRKNDSPVNLETLPLRNEVYIPWCKEFIEWHQRTFHLGVQPQLRISSMEQLRIFMNRKDSWAVVPESVAAGLDGTAGILRCRTAAALPCRNVFCLLPKTPSDEAAINLFLSCLREILSQQPGIEILF